MKISRSPKPKVNKQTTFSLHGANIFKKTTFPAVSESQLSGVSSSAAVDAASKERRAAVNFIFNLKSVHCVFLCWKL